eukprot:1970867-Prorocentrum_lima.AAC.1
MGIFVLLLVSTYARPSELMLLTRDNLVRPARGITQHWAILLNPEEGGKSSKTGAFDESLFLDSEWLQWAT